MLPRFLLIACLWLALLHAGQGAWAREPLPFHTGTWQALQQAGARPAVLVFTTTDCVHCPPVIDALDRTLGHPRRGARLIVVVMDGAGQGEALRRDSHYRRADSLYAFDGDEMALRYAVNPEWRGLTPYVAVLPRSGAARFHAGPLTRQQLDRLLESSP